MLPKAQRISRSYFPDVLKRGRSLHAEHFSLKYVRAEAKSQFSLVISKKVVRGASERHTLKRRVYEILRAGVQNPSISGIFFAKQGSAALSFSLLRKEIDGLLKQVRV